MELLSQMNDYRKICKFCDLTVCLGDGVLKTHKGILAASSDFFKRQLSDAADVLNLQKTSVEVFDLVLDFIYTGVADINVGNAKSVGEAARLFRLKKLQKFCQDFKTKTFGLSKRSSNIKSNCTGIKVDLSDELLQKNQIERSKPVSILHPTRSSRRAKTVAYATINLATRLLNSVDENTSTSRDETNPDTDMELDGATESSRTNTRDKSSSSNKRRCNVCGVQLFQDFFFQLHILSHDDDSCKPAVSGDFRGKSRKTAAKLSGHLKVSQRETNAGENCIPVGDDDYVPDDDFETPADDDYISSADEDYKPKSSVKPKKVAKPGHHKQAAKRKIPLVCHICNRHFMNSHNLNVHVNTHSKKQIILKPSNKDAKKSFCCEQCGKEFKRNSDLARHMLYHTGERRHGCPTCGKRFFKSHHLQRHKLIHTSERPFACEVCGKTFRDRDHLKRHQVTHTDERPFSCEICGKTFKDRMAVSSHQQIHKNVLSTCQLCQKVFKSAERLSKHLRRHSQNCQHVCDLCGKSFDCKARLNMHVFSHTEGRHFPCDTCGKKFRTNRTLRQHQKRHTGLGMHPCEECGKKFATFSHLKRHKRFVHFGDRPYKCEVCQKTFTRRSYLISHRKNNSRCKSDPDTNTSSQTLDTSKSPSEQETPSSSPISTQTSQTAEDRPLASIIHSDQPLPQPSYQTGYTSPGLSSGDNRVFADQGGISSSSAYSFDYNRSRYLPSMLPPHVFRNSTLTPAGNQHEAQQFARPVPITSVDENGLLHTQVLPSSGDSVQSHSSPQVANFDVQAALNSLMGQE